MERLDFEVARELLEDRGWEGAVVFRVMAAGDSVSGLEEIDFRGKDGLPRTATVRPQPGGRPMVTIFRWEEAGEAVA